MTIRKRLPMSFLILALIAFISGLINLHYTLLIGNIPNQMAETDTARLRYTSEGAYYFQSVVSNTRELIIEIRTNRYDEIERAKARIINDLDKTQEAFKQFDKIIAAENDALKVTGSLEEQNTLIHNMSHKLKLELDKYYTSVIAMLEKVGTGSVAEIDEYFEDIVEPSSRYLQSMIWTLVQSNEPNLSKHLDITSEAVVRTIDITMVAFAIFLLVALMLGYLTSKKIINPLKSLEETAAQIGTGQLDIEIDVHSVDELGSLANSFRAMVENLKRSTTSIERLNSEIEKRKDKETIIREALNEKELLLKEIHHRVKNNMQVITSLLNLQCQGITDPEVINMCKESQNRVKAMGLIHEQLYQSDEMAKIDFKEYLNQLSKRLKSSFGKVAESVAIEINVDQVTLGIDCAVPCGLIVNELVSNAFKHAFNDIESGIITIELVQNDDKQEYRLSVSDNGKGIEDPNKVEYSGSLGIQLIRTLTSQLLGKIEIKNEGGTTTAITFPYSVNTTGEMRIWPAQKSSSSKMKVLSH